MSGTFAQALAAIRSVDGWLTPEQARRLYDAAARTTAGQRIVEIGSYRGRSTIVLASGAAEGATVVAIDPHAGNDRGPRQICGFAAEADDDHRMFLANLAAAGVARSVVHIRAFSDQARAHVDGQVDVLYIDGAHRYAPAAGDIRSWGARVAPGGTLLIHDSFSSVGVTLAILRHLLWGNRFRYVGRSGSLSEYRADLPVGLRARLASALRQALQLPWFARNVLVKVLISAGLAPLVQRLTGRRLSWPY